MDRRTTVKWMLAASAAMPLLNRRVLGETPAAQLTAHGYGTDPDLSKAYHPGDLWPLILTRAQRRTAAALCDVIIPGDTGSPGAVTVGVVDFLDEWISAPYPRQQEDRTMVLEGLTWMDAEALRRFEKKFADLSESQQLGICDDICYEKNAAAAFADAAKFFARYRDLTAGGFYSTPEGRRDIGYIGNVPLVKFDGPPAGLLDKLGLGTAST
jgi:hypothetical protein